MFEVASLAAVFLESSSGNFSKNRSNFTECGLKFKPQASVLLVSLVQLKLTVPNQILLLYKQIIFLLYHQIVVRRMFSSLKCLSVTIEIRFSIEFVNQMDTFVVQTIGYGLVDKRHSQERILLNVI